MSPTILTTGQIVLNLFVLIGSALITCYCISRTRILPSLNKNNGRYTHIDGLRGLAALFVFIDHTPVIMELIGIPTTHFHFPNIKLQGSLGILGVQIFFCITAFLFSEKLLKAKANKKEIDWGDFYIHRLRRLVPLYFFTATIAIFFAALINKNNHLDMSHLVINIMKVYAFGFIPMQPVFDFNLYHIMGNIWTLVYEWRFYILMPIFFWWIKTAWKLPFSLLMVIAIVDLSASQQAVWPFFMGGFIAALVVNNFRLKTDLAKMTCLILASAMLSIPFFADTHYFGLMRWLTETPAFVLLMLAEPKFLTMRTLRFLGEISYSFYLLGITYVYMVFYWLTKIDNAANMSFHSFLQWQVVTAVSFVIVCTLTFRFIEYPFLQRKIIKDKNAPLTSVLTVG